MLHRQLLYRQFKWLHADADAIDARLASYLDQSQDVQLTLLISDTPRAGLTAVAARDAIEWLGRDTDRVIFDAFSGFNPNAFAQVCGTLKGGGELILLSPPSEQWPHYPDPEYAAFRGSRFKDFFFEGYFVQRLVRELSLYHAPVHQPQLQVCEPPFLSQQQASLVSSLVTSFTQGFDTHERTAVITADRGRGKTTALGLALSLLAKQKPLSVAVTAPHRKALDALFRAVQQHYPDGSLLGSGFEHPDLRIRFYPPRILLEKHPAVDLVIVDEAAAISVTLLKAIQHHWPNHWYATTLHGYEGNGRGFELRFLSSLKAAGVVWQSYHLTQPIRWADGDPLEALSYRLLLLDAEPSESSVNRGSNEQRVYRPVTQAELVQNDRLLQSIFGLLIAAHYRTTPNDLRQLLDSPDIQLRVLLVEHEPMAVAMLVDEGPLPADLIDAVWGGYRRPSGDLIPQTLLSREGCREAAQLRGWRVMRIAVHPDCQQNGLGSTLLAAIEKEARQRGLDFCGASFAAHQKLLHFWYTNHYAPLRLGERKDHVTAGWPLLVLNALTDRACYVSAKVQRSCAERLLLQLTQVVSVQHQQMMLRCFAGLAFSETSSPDVIEQVKGFALNQRSLDDSLLCLRKWLASPESMRMILNLSDSDQALLIGRVFQMQSAQVVEKVSGVVGKRNQLHRLREILSRFLSASSCTILEESIQKDLCSD